MSTSGRRQRVDVLEEPDLELLALGRGLVDEVRPRRHLREIGGEA